MAAVLEGTMKYVNKRRNTERGEKSLAPGLEVNRQWTPSIPFRFLACFGSISQCWQWHLKQFRKCG